jgi:hypothetical protein
MKRPRVELRSYLGSFGFIPVFEGGSGDHLVYFTARDDETDEGTPL